MRVIASIIIIALGVALGIIIVPFALGTRVISKLWDRFGSREDEQ
jgi:hypothetical protein